MRSRWIAKTRYALWRASTKMLLGSNARRVIDGYIDCLATLPAFDSVRKNHLMDAVLRNDVEVFANRYRSFDASCFGGSLASKPRYTYRLANVSLSPVSGLAWCDGRVLGESYGSLRRLLDWGRGVREMIACEKELVVGFPVIPFFGKNYYHFMMETVPSALLSIQYEPDAVLLLSERDPVFVRQVAARISEMKGVATVSIGDQYNFRIPECIITGQCEFPIISDIQMLLAAFGIDDSADLTFGIADIFISRRSSRGRTYHAQAEIEREYERKGYRIVLLETLTFSEQVNLFRGARRVAGLHGAGFTNIIFSNKLAQVTEIFPPAVFNACYSWLAFLKQQKYETVFLDT